MGVKPTIVKGSGGVFDVVVDGKLVWSKHETGRFPNEDELVEDVQALGS